MFKIGDMVVPLFGAYTGYTVGSRYNLPRKAMRVQTYVDGAITLEYDGVISLPVDPKQFELVKKPKAVGYSKWITYTSSGGKEYDTEEEARDLSVNGVVYHVDKKVVLKKVISEEWVLVND